MGEKKSQKKRPKGADRRVFNRVRVRKHGPEREVGCSNRVTHK
jgi:hypothetical protein